MVDFQTWKATKARGLAAWAAGPASKAIADTFARFKMRAAVRRVDVGPRLIHFTIAYGRSHPIAAILAHEPDLTLALGCDPDQVTMSQTRRGVVLSAPSPEPYEVTRADLTDGRGLAIPLGVTADGWETYPLTFSDTVTNLLVVAPTRAGKTTLLRTLVYGLAVQNPARRLQLALIDLKGDDLLAEFGQLEHLRYPVATTAGDAVAILQDLASEVERRVQGQRRPAHIFLVIDELIGLVRDREWGAAATEALLPIITRGGGLGICTVGSTQRADKGSLADPLIASNFTNRLVGRVANGQESALAVGLGEANAHRLLGAGDFIARIGGDMTRLQVAQTPSELIARLPTWAVAPTMPARPEPEPQRGPGRPPEPIDQLDLDFIKRHASECTTLGTVQRLLGGDRLKSRTYAERVAQAAGLAF